MLSHSPIFYCQRYRLQAGFLTIVNWFLKPRPTMPLSDLIKYYRKRQGLTQEQLAEYSNITLRTIQRIEKGETIPRAYTVAAIAKVFNKTPEDFCDTARETQEPAETPATGNPVNVNAVKSIGRCAFVPSSGHARGTGSSQ